VDEIVVFLMNVFCVKHWCAGVGRYCWIEEKCAGRIEETERV